MAAASPEPRFPIDFFEWATCVTPDVKLSGDFLRLVDADAARLTLTTDDGFVEAPAAGTYRLTVRSLALPQLALTPTFEHCAKSLRLLSCPRDTLFRVGP